MEDAQIIALYEKRQEQAVSATAEKYGGFCRAIAQNLLCFEDAEECVSDTWLTAWNRIPPAKPQSLRAFLGRITRTLAISRWRVNHAQKRDQGLTLLLSELEDCLPAQDSVEETVEARELARLLSGWLRTLPQDERVLFLRRYWYGVPLRQLAREAGQSENRMAQRMYALRQKLRTKLEQEGISI